MSTGTGQVGIRELRQNLSVYIRRVLKGEVLEVTDRGRAVALLTPLIAAASPLEQLVASGRASSPEGSLGDLPSPQGAVSRRGSRALDELRSERN